MIRKVTGRALIVIGFIGSFLLAGTSDYNVVHGIEDKINWIAYFAAIGFMAVGTIIGNEKQGGQK